METLGIMAIFSFMGAMTYLMHKYQTDKEKRREKRTDAHKTIKTNW